MSGTSAKTILIAPLDWGLGHTTRCIPVIRHLLTLGHRVLFAGDARQQAFVAAQCPAAALRQLDGYNVTYSRRFLMPGLLRQLPRLLRMIRKEHEWLQRIAQEEGIDGVISDNRYGLWHARIPCVIMTHQLRVLSGLGAVADGLVQRLHYRFLERFQNVWVVDEAGAENLGGKLSHSARLPKGAVYIGWLSHLSSPHSEEATKKYRCLVLLSGPEPQRSVLSDLLFEQLSEWQYPVAFVEGTQTASRRENVPAHIQCYGQIDASMVQSLMEASEFVICRSGYSTLMDLVRLGKRAALIPTPGQTEQEYLARSLNARRMFYATWPVAWDMEEALAHMEESAFAPPAETPGAFTRFIPVLENWLKLK